MEGGDCEFANFILPTLRHFWRPVIIMCLAISSNLLFVPQNAFFLRTRDLLVSQKNDARTLFSTLHPSSTVIFPTAAVLAFVLLRDSRFNFHCYTQREATPTQKSARKCSATSVSRLLARKITKHIHSSKPASLNRPIVKCLLYLLSVCGTHIVF